MTRFPELFRGAQLTPAPDGAVTDVFVREIRNAYELFHTAARV
jgi:hypothetical protein